MRQRHMRTRANVLVVTVLATLLAACAPGALPPAPPPRAPVTGVAQTAVVTPAAPAAPATRADDDTYTNPVFAGDFPDPHILRVGDTYYAYSTNAGNTNIPVMRSNDLENWERLGDAVPALPKWAAPNWGLSWAPGVIQIGDAFVMYHVARDTTSDRQCISRAVSDRPEGPFRDDSDAPFICQVELGGSIDAYPYRDDDGKLYVFWKNDGNCCGLPVGLWVQELSGDGLSLVGQPTELIQRDQAWERPLIENPAVVKRDGKYYLFYSGNWWESFEYAVGYAVCDAVVGPCVKPQSKPIFTYTPGAMGPGGQALFTNAEGDLWMAYHAWTGTDIGYPEGRRSLRIDPVSFADGKPVITGPTTDPQPSP